MAASLANIASSREWSAVPGLFNADISNDRSA
jgi:hypothetical protein